MCDKYDQCGRDEDTTCESANNSNFIAGGPTERICNDECIKVLGCDQTMCAQICGSCQDPRAVGKKLNLVNLYLMVEAN